MAMENVKLFLLLQNVHLGVLILCLIIAYVMKFVIIMRVIQTIKCVHILELAQLEGILMELSVRIVSGPA